LALIVEEIINMLEFYEPQADFGTPEIESETMVTLSIDGADVTVPEGTSVMRAAAEKGIKIPRLCATDSLKSFGSCRVCLVEIEGRRGFPASCTTNVEEGMQVITQSSEIGKLRRNVMELYISDHPLDCLTCPTNGDCQLQDTAGEVGLRSVRYGFEGNNHLVAEKDESNPYLPSILRNVLFVQDALELVRKLKAHLHSRLMGVGLSQKSVQDSQRISWTLIVSLAEHVLLLAQLQL
jgi:hypothetical protein